MRPICYSALALALLLSAAACAQPQPTTASNAFHLEPGTYSVGFRLIEGEDPSRAVTGGGTAAPRPRPVRTYLWYPVEPARRGSTAEPMRFGRYVALADGDVWPAEMIGSLHEKLAYSRRPLARSFDEAGFAALSQRPVLAIENARPAAGPFPLVVLGVGFWYEPAISQAVLGEYLAGRGFVVATAPLVGTNSPVVRVDEEDLETQVRDLEFAIARARELPFVSDDKLGVVGMDMGGMAGVLLAMRRRDVDVFVGLPSGILFEHPSGLPRISPGYNPLALRVPWLQIMPASGATPPPGSRSPSLFEAAVYSDRYLLLTPNLGHVDLTIDGLIDGRGSMIGGAYQQATATGTEAHRALDPYVLNFLTAFLAPEAERRAAGLAFVSRPPADPGFKMTLEHRPALPASITYDEFVAGVVAGKGAEAVERLRALALVNPNDPLLGEADLTRLISNLLFTWGLGKEALPVIELMIERYPSSPAGQGLLAEAQISAGNYAVAIDVYSKFLEQYPNDPVAKTRLEWLRNR
jgi:hypothetical protein